MLDLDMIIEDMLVYKESLGYSRSSYSWVLNNYRDFVQQNYTVEEWLSEDAVLNWCRRRDTENPSGHQTRVSKFNGLLKYLAGRNVGCYQLPSNFMSKIVRYTPYIFTDNELLSIFQEFDRVKPNSQAPMRYRILSVVYRLIYFCGLRPNEGRELLRADVDLESGVLFIRKNKAHRERYVPMSADVKKMCVEYSQKLDEVYPHSEYFFPSPDGDPYSQQWLSENLREVWKTVSENNGSRARPYDLRHRYATTIMMKWLDEGVDIYAKLPYLREFMGHENFSDTMYYIHLLPENLVRSSAIDWDRFNNLIPEVPEDE